MTDQTIENAISGPVAASGVSTLAPEGQSPANTNSTPALNEFDAALQRQNEELDAEWTEAAVRGAGLPERFHQGFATYLPDRDPRCADLKTRGQAWAQAWTRGTKGLYLSGTTGCGKTHLAAAIARRVIETNMHAEGFSRVRVRWFNVAMLFMRIRGTWGRKAEEDEADLIEEVTDPDLVVLDDLGVERPDAWALERLYVIVNQLGEDRRTLIVTSNYTGKELIDRISHPEAADLAQRLVSRLTEMVAPLGTFPARSLRTRL